MALLLSYKKVGNILASRRFATGLLVLLTGLLILGSLLPDPQLLTVQEAERIQS